jgi:acetyl esterase/lipase
MAQRSRGVVVSWPELDRDEARAWGGEVGLEVEIVEDVAEVARIEGPLAGVVLAPGAENLESAAVAVAVEALDAPVVAVDPGNLRRAGGPDPAATVVGRACTRVLYGRGAEVLRWALRHLVFRAAWPVVTLAYGDGPDQVGDLRLPEGGGPHPVIALAHGGFWYHAWERDLMDGLALDLTRRGFATWNLEYRRVGAGGGWPATGDDVAMGVDHLVELAAQAPLDLRRVVLLGHSAGGQLVLRTAARRGTPFVPALVVGMAALADLEAARDQGVGGRSVAKLLEAAPDPGEALRQASPAALVPLGVRQLLVHARDDSFVPIDQTRGYAALALAGGDDVELLELDEGGHFDLIDPSSPAWGATVAAIASYLGP